MKRILLLLTACLIANIASATILTVTDAAGTTAPGTLRERLSIAVSGDTIMFAAITDGTPILLNQVLQISINLTIIGNGPLNTILDGNSSHRIVSVSTSGITVTLDNMMFQNGQENSAQGGGILVTNGTVNVLNCELAYNYSGSAGAALQVNTNGTMNVNNCYVHDNESAGNSGAFRSYGAVNVSIANCTFTNNTGIEAITLAGSAGNVSLINTTVVNNSGKGVTVGTIDCLLQNNTIANNSNIGIEFHENSILTNNIVFGNSSGDIYADGPFTPLVFTNSKNIVGSCIGGDCPTWYSSSNPLLGSLQYNGGFSPTCRIGCDSPAYNAGTSTGTPTLDQRGMPRYGATDIGAYELQADTSTMNVESCYDYDSPSGNYTWTSSGSYMDTLPNQYGCDSIVTVNLTILGSSFGTDVQTTCGPFLWIDGSTYFSNNNTATHNIVGGSSKGCDSIVTLNLTFLDTAFGTDTKTRCNSYTWIDGNTYYSSNNTATYTFGGQAANGCDSVVTLNLTINNSPTFSTSPTSVTCFGGNDGVADVTPSGNGPFTYQWNTGQTTQDLIGVSGGNYNLLITDANGCSTPLSIFVNQPNPISLSGSKVNASCGQYNGSATVTINSGGVGPFNYTWTSGSTSATADSLASGSYTVQVVDANGCSASSTINISDSDGPSIVSSNLTEPSCVGSNDGEIDVTITGGSTPYIYNWSNGSFTEDILGLNAGSYDLIVTDANGCESSESYIIATPDPINLSNVSITEATCAGSDGEATVMPSGGTGVYTYQWGAAAGSVTTPTASGLAAGLYNIFVSDDNGCVSSSTVTINNIGAPSIMENVIIQPSCTGVQSGSIDVSVSGGVTPYSYSWSNGATTEDLTGLSPDTLELTVTDAIGCIGSYVGIVNGLTPLSESICMVTVDSISETNLVVWEKTDTASISHYNIYREGNATGVYNLVGSQPVNQISQWIDPTADPQLRSWRYKISSVDSCGNESQLSASHKTMHVTANLGVGGAINCSWDFYSGFNYGSYYISRYHSSTGWVDLDTIPSSLTSWTDPTPPGGGGLKYVVSIVPPSTCTSTKAQDHNSTRSNKGSISGPGSDVNVIELSANNSFMIYPNPANDYVAIRPNENVNYSIQLLSLSGSVVGVMNNLKNQSSIDLTQLSNGVYFILITCEGVTSREKLIITR